MGEQMFGADQVGWRSLPAARKVEALEAKIADLRTKLEAASAAEERMNDAFAGCRERLSQEIRHREAAEGRIEQARAALEPANAEGIASEGGSAETAANPRDLPTDAPSAEAGVVVDPSPDWQALAEELAKTLELVDDGGDNEWLGDDEATDFSLSGADRRCINAALARWREAIAQHSGEER
jgi:hypothetical protein